MSDIQQAATEKDWDLDKDDEDNSTDMDGADELDTSASERGPLYEKSLNDIIKYGYSDSKETRTGVHSFPSALLSWWRELAEEHKISLSKVQRITIQHGLSICAHDTRIKELRKLYATKRKEAREKRDRQLTKILEEKGQPLSFTSRRNTPRLSASLKTVRVCYPQSPPHWASPTPNWRCMSQ